MSGDGPLAAFGGYGIELEYMIVDRRTLAVAPIADRLLLAASGSFDAEIERGPLAWSNELALHVIELKTNGPAPALEPLPAAFQCGVRDVNALLEPLGACLMPGAAHPWMDPDREMRLWPHEYNAVYEAYDRIFDCRGHGWSNLQSVHLNLPFADDHEFERLHSAIRVILPLLPALAASSPVIGGVLTGLMDTRLEYYRNNARRIPSITAAVIPEPVRSRHEYEQRILAPMYADIAPFDPGGILQHEWLNSRGAIARFDRSAIEIRVLDIQEHPRADIAVAALVCGSLRLLYEERLASLAAQLELQSGMLAAIFLDATREADRAVVDDRRFLHALGFPDRKAQLREIWQHLCEAGALGAGGDAAPWRASIALILERGPLARRIADALGPAPGRGALEALAAGLCRCLAEDRPFLGLG